MAHLRWRSAARLRPRGTAMACLLAVLLTCVRPGVGGATDPGGLERRPLTLEECLSIARDSSPSLAKSHVGILNADASVLRAWSGLLPKVRNSASYYRFDDERWYVTGRGGLDHSKVRYSNTFGIEQSLFEGGGNVARVSSARSQRRSAEHEYRNALQDLGLEVKTRYIELLQAKALLQVRQEAVDLSEQHLESAEAFYRAGEKTRADVLRARVELARTELDLISARNAVKTAQADLCHALGIPVGTDVDVVDLPPPAVSAALDLHRDLEDAERSHPFLEARRARLEGARADVEEAKSARWPEVSASWDYMWNDYRLTQLRGDDHRWSQNAEWLLSLSLRFNLFDGRQTKSNIRQAEAAVDYAGEDCRQALAEVMLGVKRAHLDLVEAQEKINAAAEAVALAEEDRRLQEERYRLGEGTLLELNDAVGALTNARVSRVQAVYDYHLATARLDRAVGRD